MTMYPLVSIVTISHNEENNIRDCLESLISLDYPNGYYEIIVVDSSEDRTKEIVSEYGNVRLIPSTHKQFSEKRNIGIRTARYELIAFIDADCIVPPDWLNKMLNKISDEKVAAVACDVFLPPNCSFLGGT